VRRFLLSVAAVVEDTSDPTGDGLYKVLQIKVDCFRFEHGQHDVLTGDMKDNLRETSINVRNAQGLVIDTYVLCLVLKAVLLCYFFSHCLLQ
jgi:hypothetical protein